MDKAKIDKFWRHRTEIKDARLATNFREDGRLQYDTQLVAQFVNPGSRILDLGAGTCTLSSQFLDLAQQIVAVEKFAGFFDLVPEHPKLIKHCSDVIEFKSDDKFDIILMFGLINFITPVEENTLYQSCYSMLKENGILIVKNQCGTREEVIVDSYSEALKADYHARYPFVNAQQEHLSKLFDVKTIDIYPKEMNLWDNTHFYAFIAKRR